MTAGSDGARMSWLAGGGRRGTRLAQPAWSSGHRPGCRVGRRCWHGDPRWWAVRGDRAATAIYVAADDRRSRHDDERSTAEDDGAAQQHRTEADDAADTDDGTAGPGAAAGGRGTRARAAVPARRHRRLLHRDEGRGPRRPVRGRARHQRRAHVRRAGLHDRRPHRSAERHGRQDPQRLRRLRVHARSWASPAPTRSPTPCTRGPRWPTRPPPTSPSPSHAR